MPQRPEISIITPTKNRRALLCETIASVQQQSFPNWEHVIVDDGSDDGTAEEVARMAKADPRIRYIRRADALTGANVCRNLGAAESKADLIVFLDSDDLLAPTCLAKRIAVMGRNQDLDFATFRTGVFIAEPGDLGRELDAEMLGDDLLRFLYFECPWQTTAPIWRRVAFDRLGGFDEALRSWQDIDLHVRALLAGLRYLRFPEIDHHMRWQFDPNKTSVQQHRSVPHLLAVPNLLEKFEAAIRLGPGMNWVRQRALCGLYFRVSRDLLKADGVLSGLRVWRLVNRRRLGPRTFYLTGSALLLLEGLNAPVARLINKWQGLVRFRTNPALLRGTLAASDPSEDGLLKAGRPAPR